MSVCFGQDAERIAGLKGRILFSLLLAIAKAGAHGLTVDGNLCGKLLVVLSFFYGDDFETNFFSFPLCPLNDLALVVRVCFDKCVKIMVWVDQLVYDKLLAAQVSLVEVDRAYNGFQGVAEDDLLQVRVLLVILNDVRDTDFPRKHVERLAVHEARADFGEEPFILIGKFLVKVIRHGGTEDGISQIFEAFVGFLESVSALLGNGTVNRGKPIQLDVGRRYTGYILHSRNQLLIVLPFTLRNR